MLALGFLAYKKTSALSDYILGGRKLGPLATALSAGASDMSGWLLLGLPGLAFSQGWSSILMALGLLAGTAANWLYVSRRLRILSLKFGDALTLPAYFEQRCDDRSHAIRWISALWILVFFTFYTSAGLVAGAKLFNTVFGLPYEWSVVLGGATVVAYTLLGGFLAVSWTDVVQGFLMSLALLCIPIIAIYSASSDSTLDPNLFNESLTSLGVTNLVAWGLGYFGQPHILARFKAIDHPDQLPKATGIALSWTAISLLGAIAVGVSGAYYFKGQLDDVETVFMQLSQHVLNPWFAGVLLAAVLAAVMSTADSQLLVCSSVLSEDFLKTLMKPLSESSLLAAGRLTVFVVAIIAGALAMDPNSQVLGLVSYAWSGFGATFGPAMLQSLYRKGFSKSSCIGSLVTGAVTVVVWKNLNGGIFDVYELVPGFILAFAAGLICEKLWPASDSLQKRFLDAMSE